MKKKYNCKRTTKRNKSIGFFITKRERDKIALKAEFEVRGDGDDFKKVKTGKLLSLFILKFIFHCVGR